MITVLRMVTFALAIGWALVRVSRAGEDSLVVHEWGTFTSLQDERGHELSGINTDDEPVPQFVHNLNQFILSKPVLTSLHWQYRQKAAPRVHPYVTMRLETPVLYFYPPKSWPANKAVDVSVRFRGGWLTEFYPQAQAQSPGLKEGSFDFGELTPQTTSSLTWDNLRAGTKGAGPVTSERVWLAARNVPAANVTSENGESERYLFYRGVGRLRAPLRATLNRQSGELALQANFDEVLSSRQTEQVPALWLVQVHKDGQCAFRQLGGLGVTGDTTTVLAKMNYRFEARDFHPDNLPRLQAAMHTALVTGGLYREEADALLSTWKISYFLSPGLRLFYLVPRAWTEHYLPLSLSSDAKIERVMVGRLELTSDERRELLNKLADVPNSDGKWVERIPESPSRERFLAGRTDFGDLGVPIPADYQMYLDLGRFRNALVVHEERVRPTPNLTKFIDTYALHPFRIPSGTAASK
jgi:hypothetical protein